MTRIESATLLKPLRGQVLGREPPTLESLICECSQTKATWGLRQNDIAFTLAFWSMVDCGFECVFSEDPRPNDGQTPDEPDGVLLSGEKNLPKDWKHQTRQLYEAQFFLPPYSNCPVKLVALPAGDILCINVLATDVSRNVSLKSLAVNSSGYIPKTEEDFSCEFSGLAELRVLLRNGIIWPIRCSILTEHGVTNGSMCGVSDEIKLKIIRHLPLSDVLRLSETCHDLNRICSDQGLWKKFFHERFKHLCKCATETKKCDDVVDWKETYKEAYSRRKVDNVPQDSPSDSFHAPPDGQYGSEIDFDID